MTISSPSLRDDAARRDAILVHNRSMLVEAGAGSGKTAVMAGRIAALLAEGHAPQSIAAVTFTELAAGELLIRVRGFVTALVAGTIPDEVRIAFPAGLSREQKIHLAAAESSIDEITCSTIHGFCQRLIKPYPVEADIDPGATVIDPNQADRVFIEIVETWLRDQLSGGEDGIIAELVLRNPEEAVRLIHTIAATLRRRRALSPPATSALVPRQLAFRDAVAAFSAFIETAPAVEEETAVFAACFADMVLALEDIAGVETPAGLAQLLLSRPHPDLCTKTGTFLAYKKKGKWVAAAKHKGLSKAEGEGLNTAAETHHAACTVAWQGMLEAAAAQVLYDLITQLRPVLTRFTVYKRAAAQLDFDDLIFAARDLLRDHDSVRRALAARYTRVLVDEFQDTDPLQTEILWRLCGEPPIQGATQEWTGFHIRPGALFLVGDPKQGIYRFRGADVAAYTRAREALLAQDAGNALSISTNFRSRAPILAYVNDRFEALLSSEGQPGFTALDPFHTADGDGICVVALDVAVADETGKATADEKRSAEAEAVAEMCARLIGSEMIPDRHAGTHRACRPGDIALLAPTGNDLWRYEEALERYGIPVATQAGKGLFRRQEMQDLIALTRVLADRRDTLALGALLRGPLVGLTEEDLLDIIWALPRSQDDAAKLPRLDLGVDAAAIAHPVARATIEALQSLSRQSNGTTPHAILSQAIDEMRVRPILLDRHGGQAERALANVDLFLNLTTAFATRGLRDFAESMTEAWTDGVRAVEGRPDAQEEAVALYTIHAAKGLEWPIVVPINTMTGIIASDNAVTDRETNTFYCPVFGVKPTGYDRVRDAEKAELDRERIRLWYVAATRACELLVLPRLDAKSSKAAWISLLSLSLTELAALDLSHFPADTGVVPPAEKNVQTRNVFAAEAAAIAEQHSHISWQAPSRHETGAGAALEPETADIWVTGDADGPEEDTTPLDIQGGRERGLILHKLLEEVLTGETEDESTILIERARMLIAAIGLPITEDASQGLAPIELARCVSRTLALPEITALRPTLMAELPVYASEIADGTEQVTVGIADATSVGADGKPQAVIDWKSDVNPTPEIIDQYRGQVRKYLAMTGAERGLIVFLTSGEILTVMPSSADAGIS